MRTVSLAILSSFIATFLMVQKKNLSEAGRRIEFNEYDPYIRQGNQPKNQGLNSLRPRKLKTINNTH